VTLERTLRKNGIPREEWHRKNAIKIQNKKSKTLLMNGPETLEVCYLYFFTARQLHTWYTALQRAANLLTRVYIHFSFLFC
jgi:hypothetical protein